MKLLRPRISVSTHSTNTLNQNVIVTGFHSNQSFGTIQTSNQYDEQFNTIFTELNYQREGLQSKVSSLPSGDTSYRNNGVGLAWKYERAEIEMGGSGSGKWTEDQLREIADNGKVRGAEGHHINSVKAYPDQQGNPDNIEFVKNRDEHRQRHAGDFKNPTDGELVDRNKRLEDVNNERVLKNELTGIGMAAAIGLGVGFTIGFVTTLAQQGVSIDSLKLAAGMGIKSGLEASFLATAGHIILSNVGETISSTISQVIIGRFGVQASENLFRMCQMGVVGAVSSIVFSAWLFLKLKFQGFDTKSALVKATKSLGYSLGILFISIVSQGLWGGYAGIIVSISIGLTVVIYQFIKHQVSKKVIENIQLFSVEKMRPIIT